MTRVFKAYFGDTFDENAIRNNFTLVYELLDETMDYGYPQNCAVDVLKMYINLGEVTPKQEEEQKQITSHITGTIDWRVEGIRHKKNEVYLDALESINLLMSANGNVLRADVSGVMQVRSYLTGMPECKLGLNDKILVEKDGPSAAVVRKAAPGQIGKARDAIAIDDCTFHRCVRLGKFDADRSITFVPPDGEFELMKYRVTEHVRLPFRVMPVVEELGTTRVSYNIKTIADFDPRLFGSNVKFVIPTPPNTARCKVSVSGGKAKFEPEKRCIVWKMRRYAGGQEFTLSAEADLMASSTGKAWSRPPITAEFQVPMFPASGIAVRYLRVYEKAGYNTTKWVRYITSAGNYQIRI